MNADHADALRQCTRHFGKLEAEEATMVAVDRLGFVVRARTAEGMKGVRIAFPEEVRSREDARRVLVAMTRAARGGVAGSTDTPLCALLAFGWFVLCSEGSA